MHGTFISSALARKEKARGLKGTEFPLEARLLNSKFVAIELSNLMNQENKTFKTNCKVRWSSGTKNIGKPWTEKK